MWVATPRWFYVAAWWRGALVGYCFAVRLLLASSGFWMVVNLTQLLLQNNLEFFSNEVWCKRGWVKNS